MTAAKKKKTPLDVVAALATATVVPPSAPALAPRLGTILEATLLRVERRAAGLEKPVALPWSSLAGHFAGGLWPGLHMLTKGTGVGGTQLALEAMIHAARQGTPSLYLGLEMGAFDVGVRALGLDGRAPWSDLWTGKAGPKYLERARAAVPRLAGLPLHVEASRPHGFPPSAVVAAVEALRTEYPETDGPGSRPLAVCVDFLQLLGDEPGENDDVRVRIGRGAYVLRDLVNRCNVAILCISSIAREKQKTLEDIRSQAGLEFDLDDNARPINRRVQNAEAIIGLGKESGDIEYAADSVSVIAKVPGTWKKDDGCHVVFATAKGRATGATWSPLRFTGHAYVEPDDRGGRLVDAWKEHDDRRERVREEKRAAKDAAKDEQIERDAEAIRQYVAAHPGCKVTEARTVVGEQSRRWAPAFARLADEIVETKVGTRKELRIVAEPSRGEP